MSIDSPRCGSLRTRSKQPCRSRVKRVGDRCRFHPDKVDKTEDKENEVTVVRWPRELNKAARAVLRGGPTPKDTYGYVYAYRDPRHPNGFKVGRAIEVAKRLQQAGRTNGVTYRSAWHHPSPWHKRFETALHAQLAHLREEPDPDAHPDGAHEWFGCTLRQLRTAAETVEAGMRALPHLFTEPESSDDESTSSTEEEEEESPGRKSPQWRDLVNRWIISMKYAKRHGRPAVLAQHASALGFASFLEHNRFEQLTFLWNAMVYATEHFRLGRAQLQLRATLDTDPLLIWTEV